VDCQLPASFQPACANTGRTPLCCQEVESPLIARAFSRLIYLAASLLGAALGLQAFFSFMSNTSMGSLAKR
jgi:hypothetical protein